MCLPAIKKQFADQIRSFKGHTSKKMTILADMMDFVNEKVGVPCRLQPRQELDYVTVPC